jgi:hypothetical protein
LATSSYKTALFILLIVSVKKESRASMADFKSFWNLSFSEAI